jgi:YD repeat-containing protein
VGYDAVGNLSGYTHPNGVQTSYNYDGLKRLTQMGSAKSENWTPAGCFYIVRPGRIP